MIRYILSLFFLLLIAGKPLQAQNVQKEANVWYFGNFLGIDFNSGTAVPLNDGQLNTIEGVATISDANGSLLFYTDGIKIWNKAHQVMPNGVGLFGNPSSSQSAVIVPKIGDPTRYYVFTVDQLSGPKGLNYSIVNMTLDGGKGDVELKNVPVQLNVVEKITAVRHCNNKDVWVIAHGSASDIYYAYLVSATGINTTAVISHTGVVLPGVVAPSTLDSSSLGYLKASPDGKKIAAAHWTVNIDLSDFDNTTGIVSNSISLHQAPDPRYLSYGVEFSPNSSLLYTTVWRDYNTAFSKNELHQYDITLGSAAAIRASRQMLASVFDPGERYAALQIAPDGKMYMAQNLPSTLTPTYISSIGSPNTYGSGCNFTNSAVQWSQPNQKSSFGLPTFIQSYFYPVDSFTHTVSCQTLTGSFTYTPASNVVSVKWDFGDPASGINNTSTQNNTTHVFSGPGNYNVQLIKFTSCGTDTLKKTINTDAININLGNDTLVCGGTSLLLNSTGVGSTNNFLWQDGSTNPTFTATSPGLYWVQASNAAGCLKRDSINVDFKPFPVYNLGADLAICSGDSLIFNATVAGATSYLWNTGAASSTIKAFAAGNYWCDVKKDGCTFRDTVVIPSVKPAPIVNLGNDITVCQGVPVTLDATNPNATYQWQDGAINPVYNPTIAGLYWVEVTNSTSGCKKRDSINVSFTAAPVFNLGIDSAICAADTMILNATVANATSYLWNNGATTATLKAYRQAFTGAMLVKAVVHLGIV
jgi:PKD repeat protein